MNFEEKRIVLKNGKEVLLRSPKAEDAKELIKYLKQIASETDFMIRYEEEITMTIENEGKFLEDCLNSELNLMISVFSNDEVIGNGSINCINNKIKLKHRANLAIAIKKDYWNLGLGKILMSELITNAKNLGYEQIELEAISSNKNAIKLYEKFGFEVYGIRNNGTKYKDGSYDSETLMMKSIK